jgi:hypothetical protein
MQVHISLPLGRVPMVHTESICGGITQSVVTPPDNVINVTAATTFNIEYLKVVKIVELIVHDTPVPVPVPTPS